VRKLTTRESWLLAVLPTILLVATYVSGWRDGFTADLAARETRLHTLSGADSEGLRVTLDHRQDEVDQLNDRKSELAARAEALRDAWADPTARAATVRRISTILQGEDVRLIESVSQDEHERPAIPIGLTELSRAMIAEGGAPPELWRFGLEGRFGDVRDALAQLETLTDGELFAVPVSLSLERAGSGGSLAITLWMWI